MNQDLRDYFRRTLPIQLGFHFPQVFLFLFGQQTVVKTLTILTIFQVVAFTIYLLIFGVRRKDGTYLRFKACDTVIKQSEENKDTLRQLKEKIEKWENLK